MTPPLGFTTTVEYDRTVDGDTIDFIVSRKVRVRLLNLDTEEIRDKEEERRARAKEAKEYVDTILNNAKEIVVYIPASKDNEFIDITTFGRVLGNVYVDGKDLSEMIKDKGYEKRDE